MLALQHDTFDPVLLSLPENAFLIEHAGKPPAVVARLAFPDGVNPKAVMPVIEKVYALEEVAKHDQEPWAGVEAIKARCQIYLDQHQEWARLKTRNKGNPNWPKFPTMAAWDSKGKPALGATGSDAGRVRTYFDENGDRQRLAVNLHGDDQPAFIPPWVKQTVQYSELITQEDADASFLRCPICQHTETYDRESQSKRNMAQGRMAKHLLSAKERVEPHRELHTKVFGR